MEVNLGAIRFNWKGAYAGGTAYVVDDVVSSGGSSYICILASTGNAVSNATYWSQMSAAGTDGTDGTDIGTTITTQGDILYRDGSGLQRLAKGTAAQVLTVNSGATAPEWAAAGGGAWTKIETTVLDGTAVSEVEFTGIDTSSTYQTYAFVLTDIAADTNALSFRLQPASASNTYGWTIGRHNRSYIYNQDAVKNIERGTSTAGVDLANGANLSSEGYYSAVMYLTDGRLSPYGGANRRPHFWGTYCMNHHTGNDAATGFFGAGYAGATDWISKVRFKTSSGNLIRGTFTMYGISTA